MDTKSHVVRSTDPRTAELEAAGYVVVAESWGARLRIADDFDVRPLHAAVAQLEASGLKVQELDEQFAAALVSLETTNQSDYPFTPATPHQAPTLAEATRLWTDGFRLFGAHADAELVGVTVIGRRSDRAEEGFTVFGTGGAQVNEASRRMNEALGYVIEERWLSYELP